MSSSLSEIMREPMEPMLFFFPPPFDVCPPFFLPPPSWQGCWQTALALRLLWRILAGLWQRPHARTLHVAQPLTQSPSG